jgi:hypothetical protein
LWKRGQGTDPHYESWNQPTWTNPLLDADVIEAERTRLPERAFNQEYGAEFVEGSGAVFRNVRECATGELKAPQQEQTYWAGLDLAKVEDYTVLCIVDRTPQVVYIDRFNRIDWSLQVARIREATKRYNDCRTLVDSTGKGEPVYEALRKAGVRAQGYTFTSRSKSALIDALSIRLERRELILPRPDLCPELIDELESFEYSISDAGTVRTGAPSGVHDDTVIGLALAAWGLPKVPNGRLFATSGEVRARRRQGHRAQWHRVYGGRR